MDENSSHVNIIRIVVLGDSNVGKTCLLNRYIGNCFNTESEPSFPDLITVKTEVDGIDAKLYIFVIIDK
ncbi:hypothetical protein B4U80_14503 [Leptotrombidium deliense]|uniref:Uncharacterized protein n=1 Tax=Leptotrombidium deliense TaxID=299467 RepID=A0A443RVD5_9ACAR|nr:hypothetical protein B4U80_14503 [Leptotrombidium deliense]